MKRLYLFVISFMLMVPISVDADTMYSVDMDVYIDEYGNASITEVWDVKATSGSEWYKQLNNLGNSEISDFVVYMDGIKLIEKNWDIDESLSEKAGYYGINYTWNGIELCFGKGDMDRHVFTLKYNLSNYVFNTDDSQVLYWTLLPNVSVNNFSVDITSYYQFSDTLDVWGYGYKGYAYVSNGKISMSNEGNLINDYVVLLAKFPLNTFTTSNIKSGYSTFDDVYKLAEEGTFEYDYDEDNDNFVWNIISIIFNFLFYIGIAMVVITVGKNKQYGYVGNKIINEKNVPFFRDIPCNKDIYYANALIKLNNFGYKESNILGAIILKWVRDDKIKFINPKASKNANMIDLTMNPAFDNDIEEKLFKMMKSASKDGMLETNEFTKWCRKNYSEFLNLFTRLVNDTIGDLKSNNYIYKRKDKKECKYKNVMNDKIYNDSVELYGLKRYLKEFSKIDTKEVMEVKLWDEYLMFAYLFGIAEAVIEQLKYMYPEILEQDQDGIMNVDYHTLMYINNISTKSVSAASNARSAAQSYSSGGGGFSSGGGGGGSFGGGGSMGGR